MERMNDIRNHRELHAEIQRLKALSENQLDGLRHDLYEVRDSLKPGRLLHSILSWVRGARKRGE